MLTGGTGQVGIEVPRDRDGTFEPQIVRERPSCPSKQIVQIHELMLSEVGQESMAMFLRPDMLSPVSLTIVPVGDSVTV